MSGARLGSESMGDSDTDMSRAPSNSTGQHDANPDEADLRAVVLDEERWVSVPEAFTVDVPATSANVGVGFDCLGLGLSLANRFQFAPSQTLTISGCEERFCGDQNLVWTTYQEVLGHAGLQGAPFELIIESAIPLSGGLGSSSTCVIAGVVAALLAAGQEPSIPAIIAHGVTIEGHPDNVVPAVVGGLVSSFLSDEGELVTNPLPLHSAWRFCALCPPYEVRTAEARRVLPSEVPLSTAIWQMGRCLALPRAFAEGNGELMGKVLDDKLHEPYRSVLIPDYAQAKTLALEGGAAGFWISGSGSTMIAACLGEGAACSVLERWRKVYPTYRTFLLDAHTSGISITRP